MAGDASLFRHRDFRLLLLGQGASTLGDRLTGLVPQTVPERETQPARAAVGSGLALLALALTFTSGEVRRLAAAEAVASP